MPFIGRQPTSVPLTSSDITDGIITSAKVSLNDGVNVDNITIDGTEIDLSSGDLTVDVAGNLQLDPDDAGEVRFLDGGTQYAAIKKDGNNALLQSIVSDGDFIIQGNDGGSFVTAISTDMSVGGHVSFPNQPCFHAKNTQDADEFLNAQTVHVNIGSHYNNTNGVFTAPSAGNYYFFGGGQSSAAGAFYWALYKNGSMYAEFYNGMSGYTYGHASVAAVMTLAENDTVLFKSAGSVNMNNGGQSQFCGYKIS